MRFKEDELLSKFAQEQGLVIFSEQKLRTEVAYRKRHHLPAPRIGSDDPLVIPCRIGHIYQQGDSELGILVERCRNWSKLRTQFLRAGLTPQLNGDSEGSFSFNPEDEAQVAVVMDLAQPSKRRTLSQAHREALKAARR